MIEQFIVASKVSLQGQKNLAKTVADMSKYNGKWLQIFNAEPACMALILSALMNKLEKKRSRVHLHIISIL